MNQIKKHIETFSVMSEKDGHFIYYLYGKRYFIGISILTKKEETVFNKIKDLKEKKDFLQTKQKFESIHQIAGYWPLSLITQFKNVPNSNTIVFREMTSNQFYAVDYEETTYLDWKSIISESADKTHWEFDQVRGVLILEPRSEKDRRQVEKKLSFLEKLDTNTKVSVKIHAGTQNILFKVTGVITI